MKKQFQQSKKMKKEPKSEIKPETKETTMDEISSRIVEVSPSANEEPELPKGEINEPVEVVEQPEKKKRGRPKGSTKKHQPIDPVEPTHEASSINPITNMFNGIVVPLIANNGIPYIAPDEHKDVNKVILTPEQMKMIDSMCPQEDWMEPSWAMYLMALIGTTLTNFFQAPSNNTHERFKSMESEIERLKNEMSSPMNARSKRPVSDDELPITPTEEI